jgi:hypothetical protein
MHKSDMFITLIGTSHNFYFYESLHLRVRSRLQATFVHVRPADAVDVCVFMKDMLTVSCEQLSSSDVVNERGGQMRRKEDDDDISSTKMQIEGFSEDQDDSNVFIDRYNASVSAVFAETFVNADGTLSPCMHFSCGWLSPFFCQCFCRDYSACLWGCFSGDGVLSKLGQRYEVCTVLTVVTKSTAVIYCLMADFL